MDEQLKTTRKHRARYQRARVRNFLFTLGPDRLSGGRMSRVHLAKGVVVRDIQTSSPNWPEVFDGLRIAHVSDFHLGELVSLKHALEIVEQIKRQEPDLVACTGDVVDLHHDKAWPLLEALANIGAPLGTALVLGNHDELHCPHVITRLALDAGLHMLRNEVVQISHKGSKLYVGGIDWAKSATKNANFIDKTCGDTAHLLLAHNPKAFGRASELGIPLTLSGHTHGGHISLKKYPNVNLAMSQRHSRGLFENGPSRLYVTTGVGDWFPLRVNCPAEFAMITMRHAPQAFVIEEEEETPKRRKRRQRKGKTR
ncbi:MAG: metallophosphoesterase [Planctomycetota bacterium]|nr:metallophosphoesterase [Planctomycetota bacterium]